VDDGDLRGADLLEQLVLNSLRLPNSPGVIPVA
jgi:hypothetical protein